MEVFENLEKAVLGSIILEPYAIREVVDDLKPKCFKKRENKLIYEVTMAMYDLNLTVQALSKDHKQFEPTLESIKNFLQPAAS